MSAPQTERILDQTATLFKDGPQPIYLLPDGRFAVKYGGKWEVKRTLKAVEKLLGRDKPSLKLMRFTTGISFTSRDFSVADVAEWSGHTLRDKEGKRVYHGWGSWHLFDQEIADALTELDARRERYEKELNKDFERITKKAVRIDEDSFKARIKKEADRGN